MTEVDDKPRPMSNSGVAKWLDDDENDKWTFLCHAHEDEGHPDLIRIYRKLALTREALASCDPHLHGTRCHLCGERATADDGHKDDCIFKRIPNKCRDCGMVYKGMKYFRCSDCHEIPLL